MYPELLPDHFCLFTGAPHPSSEFAVVDFTPVGVFNVMPNLVSPVRKILVEPIVEQ